MTNRRIDLSLASALVAGVDQAATLAAWLSRPFAWLNDSLPIAYACLMRSSSGSWQAVHEEGERHQTLPTELIAECLDTHRTMRNANWTVVLVPTHTMSAMALAARPNTVTPELERDLETFADALAVGMDAWSLLRRQQLDLQRTTQMLEIAADWHNHNDLKRLLEAMAQAATRLMEADRASIFLWDKSNKQLVGHPALGVEGKPLRVPDDAGIAGAVLRSLEPRRWDRSDSADEVDRRVDAKVGYKTDSLLAVPLVDGRGKAIGVFEVLNRRSGQFSEEDERSLIDLARHAAAALVNTQRTQTLIQTRDRLTQNAADQIQLVGQCQAINDLRSTIERVAGSDLAVLLLGENGTGKEVVSRQLHYHSRRRYEPFIAVNCAALAESLLESELFGHEKGAFTDAHEARSGKFELANGGTLFLDEIGDMSLGGQAKLLRVLEEKMVVRVGGSFPIPVDVRLIAATNQNLVELVQKKKFREDLYFRLTVVTLNIPPLRERGEDVLMLADFFLDIYCQKIGRGKPNWSNSAKRRLIAHTWPGNVRELRNLIERLVYMVPKETFDESEIDFVRSPKLDTGPSDGIDMGLSLADATAVFQQKYIERHIRATSKNMTQAAENLGLQRSNLYRKMKQLGMEDGD